MNCRPSGGSEIRTALCALALAGLFGCAGSARAPAPAPPAAVTSGTASCKDGPCPTEIDLAATLGGQPLTLAGRLSPDASARRYRFCIAAPRRLEWKYSGHAARLLLAAPDGEVAGPGLSQPEILPRAGCYVLGVSANTMADDAYGDFTLTLSLLNP